MVNLNEVFNSVYIPKHILEKTDEQYCRDELSRYLQGAALDLGVSHALYNFQFIGNIKEYDFCEEQRIIEDRVCTVLIWKKRLPLQ